MFAAGILAKKYAPNPSGTIAALGALGGAANISTQTISRHRLFLALWEQLKVMQHH